MFGFKSIVFFALYMFNTNFVASTQRPFWSLPGPIGNKELFGNDLQSIAVHVGMHVRYLLEYCIFNILVLLMYYEFEFYILPSAYRI